MLEHILHPFLSLRGGQVSAKYINSFVWLSKPSFFIVKGFGEDIPFEFSTGASISQAVG
jgi:hypothetical protein